MKTEYNFTTLRHKKRYETKAIYVSFIDNYVQSVRYYFHIKCYDDTNNLLFKLEDRVVIENVPFNTIGKQIRSISNKLISQRARQYRTEKQ